MAPSTQCATISLLSLAVPLLPLHNASLYSFITIKVQCLIVQRRLPFRFYLLTTDFYPSSKMITGMFPQKVYSPGRQETDYPLTFPSVLVLCFIYIDGNAICIISNGQQGTTPVIVERRPVIWKCLMCVHKA